MATTLDLARSAGVSPQDAGKALELALRADLDGANETLRGFGIEYVEVGEREIAYVNLGDTYQLTLISEYVPGRGNVVEICSWGGWYEEAEQEYEEDTGTIRCGYCSEFTPHPEGVEWREVVCESCGHCVAGD